MIKAIVFDGQGTLFHSVPKTEMIQNVLIAQGQERKLEEIEQAFLLSKKIAVKLHEKNIIQLNDEGYKIENEIRFMLLGFDEKESVRLAEIIGREWTNATSRTAYSETARVLEYLKNKGYKIGLLTAGVSSSYNITLKRLNLDPYFDLVVGEDTVNAPKPDPRAYAHTIEKLGCAPSEILFVGDHPINDYEGPRKSGMHSVLVDREGKHPKEMLKIKTLDALLEDSFLSRISR